MAAYITILQDILRFIAEGSIFFGKYWSVDKYEYWEYS